MMNDLYVIVTNNHSSHDEVELKTYRDMLTVRQTIAGYASRGGLEDDVEVVRVFSFDSWGRVTHYEIVFRKGRLELEKAVEKGQFN